MVGLELGRGGGVGEVGDGGEAMVYLPLFFLFVFSQIHGDGHELKMRGHAVRWIAFTLVWVLNLSQ